MLMNVNRWNSLSARKLHQATLCQQFVKVQVLLKVALEKVFAKLHFKQEWTSKRYKNKAEMKERKKTTLPRNYGGEERQEDYPIHLMQQVWGSLLVLLLFLCTVVKQSSCIFHLYLVFVLFLYFCTFIFVLFEMKVCRHFFFWLLFFGGF